MTKQRITIPAGPRKGDIEWTIDLGDEEPDVLIEYSWSPGYPGCGPSLNHPGDPPEPCEVEFLRVSRLDNGVVLNFDPYERLSESALESLIWAIDEREQDDYDDPSVDWRNEW